MRSPLNCQEKYSKLARRFSSTNYTLQILSLLIPTANLVTSVTNFDFCVTNKLCGAVDKQVQFVSQKGCPV